MGQTHPPGDGPAQSTRLGRPSSFTQEVADAICLRLADGESLREICRDESMPGRETVRRWLLENEGFRGQYARAREDHADSNADHALEIAHASTTESAQRDRLEIDTLKWRAARMAPKRWGDSSAVTLQNPDGSALGLAGILRQAHADAEADDAAPAPEGA